MLRAICHAVDAILDEHEYGSFLEAGARLGRDIACRAADTLEAQWLEANQKLTEREPGGVTYNPKGKKGDHGGQ